jgi:hypothetical protein
MADAEFTAVFAAIADGQLFRTQNSHVRYAPLFIHGFLLCAQRKIPEATPFNHFLYDGQVDRIRKYRETLGMGRKPFAREMEIPLTCLREWKSIIYKIDIDFPLQLCYNL